MKICLDSIVKEKNRIEFLYHSEGLDEYIDTSIRPFYEYDCNIEGVPDSIAVVPFIANLLPLCFALDAEIYVKELDETFYNQVDAYREGYQKMIPMLRFGGKVISEKLIENKYETKKNCLLFSGGIDATNSLSVNDEKIDDCITIWGSDIRCENVNGWTKMSSTIEDTVTKFGKRWIVIRSNFRDYINESTLGQVIKVCGDGWWHAMQHGVALLGQVAPLAFLNHYKNIFIASSNTADHRPICASDPLTDNCFRVGSSLTIHDGFEFNRCEKVKNIFKKIDEKNITLKLHVCWQSSSGENCGHCEKCIRSYLNCRAVGGDSERIGLTPTISMAQIKNFYLHHMIFDEVQCININPNIAMLNETYGENIPNDLKWLAKLKPERVNKSLYWRLKYIYLKVKKLLIKR